MMIAMKKTFLRFAALTLSVVTLFSGLTVYASTDAASPPADKTNTAVSAKQDAVPLAAPPPNTTQIMPGAAVSLDKSRINLGILCVVNDEKDPIVAVLQCADTKQDYTYDLPKGVSLIPLQANGSYKLQIGRIGPEKTAKVILKDIFDVAISVKGANERWLISSVLTRWTKDMKPIKDYATAIEKGKLTDDLDKIKIVYSAIVKEFGYDDRKAETLSKLSGSAGYSADIETTYKEKAGVCTDFSTLFAAAMRSQGIPCKLVKGYSEKVKNTLHAWNEVYIGNEWRIIDLTEDICYHELKLTKGVSLFKDASIYTVTKVY